MAGARGMAHRPLRSASLARGVVRATTVVRTLDGLRAAVQQEVGALQPEDFAEGGGGDFGLAFVGLAGGEFLEGEAGLHQGGHKGVFDVRGAELDRFVREARDDGDEEDPGADQDEPRLGASEGGEDDN